MIQLYQLLQDRIEMRSSYGLEQHFILFNLNILFLDQFLEFDYSPYNCFNKMEESETGKYRIKGLKNRIPMVYALAMTKPS